MLIMFWFNFKLNQATFSMCYLSKVSQVFSCTFAASYFRPSSIRLPIKWFLIKKKTCIRQCELNLKQCHMHIVLVQLCIEPGNSFNVLFPFSSKSFLNFRPSSTRFLIKWFLLKRTCAFNFHPTNNLRFVP